MHTHPDSPDPDICWNCRGVAICHCYEEKQDEKAKLVGYFVVNEIIAPGVLVLMGIVIGIFAATFLR